MFRGDPSNFNGTAVRCAQSPAVVLGLHNTSYCHVSSVAAPQLRGEPLQLREKVRRRVHRYNGST